MNQAVLVTGINTNLLLSLQLYDKYGNGTICEKGTTLLCDRDIIDTGTHLCRHLGQLNGKSIAPGTTKVQLPSSLQVLRLDPKGPPRTVTLRTSLVGP